MSFRIDIDEMHVAYPILVSTPDAVCRLLQGALSDVDDRNAREVRDVNRPNPVRTWWYVETVNTVFVAHRSIVLGVRRHVELAVPSE